MENKVSINLVTYNGSKYLPYLFNSLKNQTYRNYDLLVIDNASTDNTLEVLKKEAANFQNPIKIVANNKNTYFAAGYNQAFAAAKTEYFLVLNQDVFLAPDCLAKLVPELRHARAAVVAPRLMNWDFNNKSFTNKIDALGLKVYRNRRVLENMQGKKWKEAEKKLLEVFGVSGAMALFNTNIITGLGGLFDENFIMYKEDVDLAYRLQAAGLKSYVVLDAVCWHDRSSGQAGKISNLESAANKLKQPDYVRINSYRNHLRILYKNEYWQNLVLDFPFILWYELRKLGHNLLLDWPALKGLGQLFKQRKQLTAARKRSKELRKVSWRQIRKWWVSD